jgi:hypothetical protein
MSDVPKNKPQVDPSKSIAPSYPANNRAAKDQASGIKKDITPLEGIQAQKQKTPLRRRMRDAFTGDDASSIGEYVLLQLIIPAIKSTLFDVITGSANRALFGQGIRPGQTIGNRQGVVNYSGINRNVISSGNAGDQRALSQREMSEHNFSNIILDSRQDAERVLGALVDILDKYNMVTVSDLYELVNITGSFVDDKWGWFNLGGATISPVRGGFVLNLPTTEEIR